MIWLFEVERALFRIFLVLMCLSMLRRVWRTLVGRPPAPPPDPEEWPAVTVQLPVCDEGAVAERVVRAAAAFDYPRFDLQVLDDSRGAETRARLDGVVASLRAAGVDISLLRRGDCGDRGDRGGFKAGNLAFGLARARGELIAIFDADAVPPRDFLRRTVPWLCAEDRVGMVQTRHHFENRDRSWLTRVQALLLDGLMLVEQLGQSLRGRPLHFNGSAGVWRKQCIAEAGGWRGEVSAEDLDLSHRAVLAGWRFVQLVEPAVGSSSPETMAAVRVQQERWTRGKVEALRRVFAPMRASSLPAAHRLDVMLPVAGRLLFPFLALLTVTMPFSTLDWIQVQVKYTVAEDAVLFLAVLLSAALYYSRAAQLAGRRALEGALLVPGVVALVFGLSLSSTVAWVRGLARRPPSFAPTPKRGDGPRVAAVLPARERVLAGVEILLGMVYTGFTAVCVERHLLPAAAFFAFVALAWLWVGVGSLRD